MSTAACTAVAFVAGALAWWGPKFIALGLATQQGHQDVSLDEYVNFRFNSVDMIKCQNRLIEFFPITV